MRILPSLLLLALLAGCGADGLPSHPDASPETGFSGEARIGVSGSL